MDSSIRKRSVTVAGHSTSVSLEAAFWDALKTIATSRGVSVNTLIERIDQGRSGNLSSAIRVFVLAEVSAGSPGAISSGAATPGAATRTDPCRPTSPSST